MRRLRPVVGPHDGELLDDDERQHGHRDARRPAAFVQRRLPSDSLFYTLCASATFTYASGYQSSTGTRCAPADTGVAVVRG